MLISILVWEKVPSCDVFKGVTWLLHTGRSDCKAWNKQQNNHASFIIFSENVARATLFAFHFVVLL